MFMKPTAAGVRPDPDPTGPIRLAPMAAGDGLDIVLDEWRMESTLHQGLAFDYTLHSYLWAEEWEGSYRYEYKVLGDQRQVLETRYYSQDDVGQLLRGIAQPLVVQILAGLKQRPKRALSGDGEQAPVAKLRRAPSPPPADAGSHGGSTESENATAGSSYQPSATTRSQNDSNKAENDTLDQSFMVPDRTI
jgi:hypothetical protein